MRKLIVLVFIIFWFSSFSQARKLALVCKETTEENADDKENPIIIKTCFLDKFISIGSPDYKGRYFWEYQLYKKVNSQFVKTTNSDIFKKITELENLINSEIQKEYNSIKDDPELKDCVSFIELKHFSINEMGIDFDENNNMVFNSSFEIPPACLNVDRSMIPLNFNLIINYLK